MKLKEGYIEVPDEDEITLNSARYSAIRVLSRFERSDSYIDKLVDYELRTGNLNQLDKALFTEIVNGVIRWKNKLDYVLVGFYQGDYMKCLNFVKNAMRVALYQLMFLTKIPASAAINESVEIVKNIQGDKTAGIVNGVLRNITRNVDNIRYPEKEDDLIYHYSVMYSHPRWMIRRWLERFGEEETEQLLFKNNARPYIPLRINTLLGRRDELIKYLNDRELKFFISKYYKNTIILKTTRNDLAGMDLFKAGHITVQDPAASLAVVLADPKPGMDIIDLCAAPGGKSFLLAELALNEARITSVDKYPVKLDIIRAGAERLRLKDINPVLADARQYVPDKLADLVFADVPCSGLGVLSKKPDIKWKKERDDVYQITELQKEIITSASKMVKPGGVLIYSTCSIEPEENTDIAKWFLENNSDFELENADKYILPEVVIDGFMQTFPHIQQIDGAFAARFKKKS